MAESEQGSSSNMTTSRQEEDELLNQMMAVNESELFLYREIDAERARRVPDAADVPYDEKTRDATIAATVRDLKSWSIAADEVTVSFDPYAVGSYAEGSYTCSFAMKDVKALALKGAALP